MKPSPHAQLELIYRQLGRSSGFRGFKPGFLLAVAVAAGVSTIVTSLPGLFDSVYHVAVAWIGVAVVIASAVFALVLLPALRSSSTIRRAAAQATGMQMVFPMSVGAVMTLIVLLDHPTAVPYLPAAWLAIFALGVSALSGLIRERVEYVALFYVLAAIAAYLVNPDAAPAFGLTVGVSFTLGHLFTAWVLSVPKERVSADARDELGERDLDGNES